MARNDDRFVRWAEDEVTQEIVAAARERIVREIEAAPMGSEDDRDHVLEMVRQLKAVRALKQSAVSFASRQKIEESQRQP